MESKITRNSILCGTAGTPLIGVSAEVASEMIGVGVRTMWNLAKEEKIRTVRIGTRVIFSAQSLREFVDGKPVTADKSDIACVAEGKERNEWQH